MKKLITIILVVFLVCCFSYGQNTKSWRDICKPSLSPNREIDSLRCLKDPQVMRLDSLHHELAFNKTENRVVLHEKYNAVKDSIYVRINYIPYCY